MNRITGLLVVNCNGANPNGDPDNNNVPRMYPDGKGWMSAESIKRKFRNIIQDHDDEICQAVFEKCDCNPDNYHILESYHRGFDASPQEATKKAHELYKKDSGEFLKKYWDTRLFGATFIKGKKNKTETGEKGISYTGGVSFQVGTSVCPVELVEATNTKMAPVREDLPEYQGDLAPQSIQMIRHAIYCIPFGIMPNVVKKANGTEKDIEVFKTLIPLLFAANISACRPVGSMEVIHAYWAEHDNILGSFQDFDFYEYFTPNSLKEYPLSKNDYSFAQIEKFEKAKVIDLI